MVSAGGMPKISFVCDFWAAASQKTVCKMCDVGS